MENAAVSSRVDEGRLTRFHWKIEVVGGMHLLLFSVDLGLLAFILAQLVPEWGLTPWQVGAIGMSNAFGTLIGGLLVGPITDRIGRKLILRFSLVGAALGTMLGAFAWNTASLSIFQFLAGAGSAGIAPCVGVLITEFAPARSRGRLSALLELFWISGWLVAAIGAYFILPVWGWRAAFVFGGIPLLYAAIQGRLVPESPRFLMSRGRIAEAKTFLDMLRTRYGIVQDLPSAFVAPVQRGALAGIKELWSGQLARRTACTWILWFVLVFIYYGVFIWVPTLLSTSGFGVLRTVEVMLILTLAQYPAIVLAAFLIDWIGRKWLLVPVLFLCGIACYLFGEARSYFEIVFWGCLISATDIVGWGIMLGYTPELFPTRLRGTGSTWAATFGRIGGITVPGAMALLLGSWSNGYQMVFFMFSAVLLFGAVMMAILGEETKGRTLEEISAQI